MPSFQQIMEQDRETMASDGMGLSSSSLMLTTMTTTTAPERRLGSRRSSRLYVPDITTKDHVSFGVVEIREYPIIMGDHPSTKLGPPLTIDWQYEEEAPVSVEEYDAVREPNHRNKKMKEMRLSAYYRRTLLKELRYSVAEVKQRENEVSRVRRQRATSKFLARIQKFEEKFAASLKKGSCRSGAQTVPVMVDEESQKSMGTASVSMTVATQEQD